MNSGVYERGVSWAVPSPFMAPTFRDDRVFAGLIWMQVFHFPVSVGFSQFVQEALAACGPGSQGGTHT